MPRLLVLAALAAGASSSSAQQPQCRLHSSSAATSTAAPPGKALHIIGPTIAECCGNCSANAQCQWFNWHPHSSKDTGPPWCELLAGPATVAPSGSKFIAGQVTARPPSCTTQHDCSLAGECVGGKCVCDGWTHGEHCNILNLQPADSTAYGYRNASGYNSWGGASIQDPETKKWYLFASQIAYKCTLLGHWATLSEGVRLVSTGGATGPWVFDAVVLSNFAHNIKPFRAPDGTWLIYFIGAPNNVTHGCLNMTTASPLTRPASLRRATPLAAVPASFPPGYPRGHTTAGPIFVASAGRVDAPPSGWMVHGPLTDSMAYHTATNPSAVIDANGSVTLAVSRGWETSPTSGSKSTTIMYADSWRGPYINLTHGYTDSIQSGEDPDMFKTKRGWHMLNHNTGPGSSVLGFSADGLRWTIPKFAPNAFNETVVFDNGTAITVCQRQRPQVVFADDGMPGWLWSGVMDSLKDGACPDDRNATTSPPTWTLAQAIGRP